MKELESFADNLPRDLKRKIKKQLAKHSLLGSDTTEVYSKVTQDTLITYQNQYDLYGDLLFKIKNVNKNYTNVTFIPDPDYVVEVFAMNEKGQTKWIPIVEFSMHVVQSGFEIVVKDEFKNKIKSASKSMIVSDDHSLVVYDTQKKTIRKATPRSVYRDRSMYYFVGYPVGMFEDCIRIQEYPDLAFIPVDWFEFRKTKDVVLYDVTTADAEYNLFRTALGLFVVDTAIVYAVHTEEAKKEAQEKMTLSKNLISSESISDFTYGIDKNALFGVIVGSQTAQELNLKYKPKEFKINVKSLDELKQKLKTELAGKYSIFDFVYVDGKKMTIGQAFISFAIQNALKT